MPLLAIKFNLIAMLSRLIESLLVIVDFKISSYKLHRRIILAAAFTELLVFSVSSVVFNGPLLILSSPLYKIIPLTVLSRGNDMKL